LPLILAIAWLARRLLGYPFRSRIQSWFLGRPQADRPADI
jgi:hypothetical protein